jgi:thiamine phosphate synthase YjbQ (UPF0047 family)
MKDNLLPFNLEEAKKDPSRICWNDDREIKAVEAMFFKNGFVSVLWSDGVCSTYEQYDDLRLTPKRMFVNLYEDKTYYLHDTIEKAKEATSIMSRSLLATYELIPVEEK